MGNSTDPGNTIQRGESSLKLTRNDRTLTVASWFTPYHWQDLENDDIDLGSARNIVLNWPANFSTGFTLQSSANLATAFGSMILQDTNE